MTPTDPGPTEAQLAKWQRVAEVARDRLGADDLLAEVVPVIIAALRASREEHCAKCRANYVPIALKERIAELEAKLALDEREQVTQLENAIGRAGCAVSYQRGQCVVTNPALAEAPVWHPTSKLPDAGEGDTMTPKEAADGLRALLPFSSAQAPGFTYQRPRIHDAIAAALAVLDAQAERDKAAEAALPEFVRVFREAAGRADADDKKRVLDESANDPEAHAAMRCLEWLAIAPAKAMSRLGLRGDVLKAVREWQTSSNGEPVTEMLDELLTAELYDVSELAPLLQVIRGMLGEGYPDSKSKLDAIWETLPPKWHNLAGLANFGTSTLLVEAPGDRCGNSKKLPNGQPCPGCRACS